MSDHGYEARAQTSFDDPAGLEFRDRFQADPAGDFEAIGHDLEGAAGLADPSAKSTDSSLATIVRLQSSELERLARENDRLMDRIDTLLRLQEREQVLRQQMQAQIGQLGERIAAWQPQALPASGAAAKPRHEDDQIKPVLLAMLDLLERIAPGATGHAATSPRPTIGEAPAESARQTHAATSAADAAKAPPQSAPAGMPPPSESDPAADRVMAGRNEGAGEAFRLPEILRRPIEDLTTARRTDVAATTPATPAPRAAAADPPPGGQGGRPAREERRRRGAPALFAWTSIFS